MNKLTLIERRDGSLLAVVSYQPGLLSPSQCSELANTLKVAFPNTIVVSVPCSEVVWEPSSVWASIKSWWRNWGAK